MSVTLTLLALGSLLLGGQPTSGQIEQWNVTTYPPKTLHGNGMTCPADEDRERTRNGIFASIRSILVNTQTPCGPGWTLLAFLNMTNPVQQCPSPWTEHSAGNKRMCFRSTSSGGSCDSVIYSNVGVEYNQVCGRIIGYQYGNPHGFFPYHAYGYSIDSYYIDGISVTHGQQPRMHIWTFAAGYSEVDDHGSCPCSSIHQATIPTFIGNNYFCETGTTTSTIFNYLYSDDPLWDGEGCGPGHSCECTLNSPPWFTAQLPNPTTDGIEVRSCSYAGTSHKNVGIELIELYVKYN